MNVFSFSGGRTSAYMLQRYYKEGDLVIFANTGKEAEETLDFVEACSVNWGISIIWLEYTTTLKEKFRIVDYKTANRTGVPFKDLCIKKKYLPNIMSRFCSMELKALTIKRYLKSIGVDLSLVNMFLGIRADERRRYFKLKDNNRNKWFNCMPLYKAGITKVDVLNFWKSQKFDLFINKYAGNCDLCFLKGSAKKIELLRAKPEIAKFWIDLEEEIGATFNKDYSTLFYIE